MARLSADEKDLLGRIVEKPELQPFFFRKAKGLKWFDALLELGFFNPEKNPPPRPAKEEGYMTIPFWPAAEYLVSASEELSEAENEPYIEKLLRVVRLTTSHAKQAGFSNYRTWWQFAKIIRNVPVSFVRTDDVQLVDYWLDDPYDRSLVGTEVGSKWLNDLLEMDGSHAAAVATALLDVLFKTVDALPTKNSRSKKGMFRFDDWHAEKISGKVAGKSGRRLGVAAAEILRRRLEEALLRASNDEWSTVWRRAIEDHEQDQYNHNPESVLISAYRDCVLAFLDARTSEAVSYVEDLLENKYLSIRRIAVFAISERFLVTRDLANRLLQPSWFKSHFRHELWHLLNKHFSYLRADQREAVLDIVAAHEEKDEGGKVHPGFTSHWRATWLSAVKDQDERASRMYVAAVRESGGEPSHPDFSSYMTAGPVVHRSPFSLEELLAVPIDQLARKLNSVRDEGHFVEPGIQGLAKTVRQLIKTEPLRYVTRLNALIACDLAYIHEIIEGYAELWNQKATLPWDDVWRDLLGFLEDVTRQDEFWSESNAAKRKSFVANRYWTVSSIARLIESGVKDDGHAFHPMHLPRAEQIVLFLMGKEESEDFEEMKDAVSTAINSPRGQLFEALINLTLRNCRLEERESQRHDMTWSRFVSTYEKELDRKGALEVPTLFANYLPNFLYMSKKWTLDNLPRIFDVSRMQWWRCAMQGYAYVGTVYDEVYGYLKSSGSLVRALDDSEISDKVQEKVVQNIGVAYLAGFEEIGGAGSLIDALIGRRRESEVGHLVWFVWTKRADKEELNKERVFALWRALLENQDLKTPTGRKLASKLCTWLAFVEELTPEIKSLLLPCLKFADEEHNAFEVLEGIARISAKQPRESYELWLQVLDGSHPDFPDEALHRALENLIRSGPEGLRHAREIADRYIQAGNDKPARIMQDLTKSVARRAN